MKGKDKDIILAKKIDAKIYGFIDEIERDVLLSLKEKGENQSREAENKIITEWEFKRKRIKNAEYAKDIIDLFGEVKDPQELKLTYESTHINTPSKKWILCQDAFSTSFMFGE